MFPDNHIGVNGPPMHSYSPCLRLLGAEPELSKSNFLLVAGKETELWGTVGHFNNRKLERTNSITGFEQW